MGSQSVHQVKVIANWVDRMSGEVLKSSETIKKFGKKTNTSFQSITDSSGKVIDKLQTTTKSMRKVIDSGKIMTRQQANINKMMQGGAQRLVDNSKRINKLGQQHEGFFKVLGMGQENWQKFNKEGGRFNKRTSKAANGIRKFTHGLRGFRMEMLGVMFFGMGMQKFLTGLLRPALELTGVFKVWSLILQLLFLPIAMALLPIMLQVLDMVLGWSEETKLLIGKLVIAGIVIAGFLFLLGMFALGIGAIIMVGSSLFNLLDKLIPDINVAGVNISSFIEAGLGIGIIKKLWGGLSNIVNNLLNKFLEFDFVKKILEDLGVVVGNKTPWEVLKAAAKSAWEEVQKQLKLTTDDIGDDSTGLIGMVTKLKDDATKMWTDFKDKMEEINVKDLTTSITNLSTELSKMIPPLETIAKVFNAIAKAVAFIRGAGEFGAGSNPFNPDVSSILSKKYPDLMMSKADKRYGYAPSQNSPFPLPSAFTQQSTNFAPTTNMTVHPTSTLDLKQIMSHVNNTNETQFYGLTR